jgi:adenylylsulfate kinase-like enzyme
MQLQSKKKGILFLITGAQGSGKTTLGKKLVPKIKKKFGKTIYCDGDILRRIFNFNDYSIEGRKKLDEPYFQFCNYIINQKINLIFTTVSANWTIKQKKNIKNNFFEIYVTRHFKLRKKIRKKIISNTQDQKIIKSKTFNIKVLNNDNKKTINTIVDKILKKIKISIK